MKTIDGQNIIAHLSCVHHDTHDDNDDGNDNDGKDDGNDDDNDEANAAGPTTDSALSSMPHTIICDIGCVATAVTIPLVGKRKRWKGEDDEVCRIIFIPTIRF